MKDEKVEDKKIIQVAGGNVQEKQVPFTAPAPLLEYCTKCEKLVYINLDGTCPICGKKIV